MGLIRLLTIVIVLQLFWYKITIAQNGVNTDYVWQSTPEMGNFIDIKAEGNIIYCIVTKDFSKYYLNVYNTSNPDSLHLISQREINFLSAYPTRIKKYGDKIIILYRSISEQVDTSGGIQIFQVGLEQKISFISQLNVEGYKYNLDVTDKYIFVAAGESGLYIVDYQNPQSPFVAGKYDPGNYSIGNGVIAVSVSGNYACISMFDKGMDIINLSDIAHPKKVSSFPSYNGTVNNAILVGNYAYVFVNNYGMAVLDVSDPQNPTQISGIKELAGADNDVSIYHNYLFVSWGSTKIIDISNKYHPICVGYFHSDSSNSDILNMSNNLRHSVSGNYLYVIGYLYSWNPSHKLFRCTYDINNSSVSITFPNDSTSWLSGDDKYLNVTSYNLTKVNLEISPDGGNTWQPLLTNYPISTFRDEIPFVVPKIQSSNCLFKISNSDNINVFDISSKPVEINRLIINSPSTNFPSYGKYNSSMYIAWYTLDLDSVSIYYSLDDGNTWNTIIKNFTYTLYDNEQVPYNYTWNFKGLTSSQCRIKIANANNGNEYVISQKVSISSVVNVKNEGQKINYHLYGNYPNPFNPSTTIKYSIANSGSVILKVYNISGQNVTTLVNKFQQFGIYKVKFQASKLPSGIYFYRIQAGSYTSVKKMILIK